MNAPMMIANGQRPACASRITAMVPTTIRIRQANWTSGIQATRRPMRRARPRMSDAAGEAADEVDP